MKKIIVLLLSTALAACSCSCGKTEDEGYPKDVPASLSSGNDDEVKYDAVYTKSSEDEKSVDSEISDESPDLVQEERKIVTDNSELNDPDTYIIKDMYIKDPETGDIITDKESGLRYVKNQLLISAVIGTDRSNVEDMLSDEISYLGFDVSIVGEIPITSDYQIEFSEDMDIDQLELASEYFMSYPFVSNVTLNLVSEIGPGCE